MGSKGWTGLVAYTWSAVWLAAISPPAIAQFSFNFTPSGTVVPSVANVTCNGAGGGMGGMGAGGICDGTPFSQQVVSIGGNQYYHVIVGDGGGSFGIESYIRTAPGTVCWYGCASPRVALGGMMGGGGPSPLSSSSGSATNDSAPLASTNAGTGRPDRAAIRMFINDAQMTQEFLKNTETAKPRITQTISSAQMTLNFSIDMSNIGYNTLAQAGTVTLIQNINEPDFPPQQNHPVTGQPLPNSARFDISGLAETANRFITGGRYTYTPGGGDGGSLGSYAYFADGFDIYGVDWQSFCDPAQNPVSNCVNYGGARGGMGVGGMGGGGGATMGGGTGGGTGGGATMGGGTGGGMSGGGTTSGGGATTTIAATTTTTIASGSTGGGMGGGSPGGGSTGGPAPTPAPSTTTTLAPFTTTTTLRLPSTTQSTTTSTTTTSTLGGGSSGMGGMGGGL